MEGLSINNIITNEDIVITYTPSSNVINYSYVVIKNNSYGLPIYINNNLPTEIKLTEEGSYRIEVTENGVIKSTGQYVIDKTAPIISIAEKTHTITNKERFSYDGVSASDIIDGDLTNNITSNIDDIDFSIPGIKKINYEVSDNAGNIALDTVYVTVKKDNTNLILTGQIATILAVLFVIIFLIKYIRSIKLEKRFSKYTINSSLNKSISLFDNLSVQYDDFIKKISEKISGLNIINKIRKKYTKYITAFELNSNPINVISNKIVLGFVFIFISIIINLFRFKLISFIEMILPFLLGFYILDIIYIYKYILYKKKIESDLLDAITIMNNAFKSGRSIIQAIDLVSKELTGPISKEFKKISMEINLGLDIEVAFKRFSDRINIEEAMYLSSSLAILNKTGGNIIKVFNSIEKTLFNRKKLQEELKALTSSSKMISYILMVVPILFAVFLSIIDSSFFLPLFSNALGIIVLILMLILYITYIIIIKKVMKVRL